MKYRAILELEIEADDPIEAAVSAQDQVDNPHEGFVWEVRTEDTFVLVDPIKEKVVG